MDWTDFTTSAGVFIRLQNDSATSWPRAWKFTSQPNLCKGKQTAISNTPAAAIDNFSPLGECMCHSGRRCLFASGSYGWHSGPQHITDSFCPWFRQPCHCQCVCVCVCQMYSCWPLQKVLDAAGLLTGCPGQFFSLCTVQSLKCKLHANLRAAFSDFQGFKYCTLILSKPLVSHTWWTKCLSHVEH